MAEFWSNNDRGYRIRLWIDQVSQNFASNSSQVRVRLSLLNTTTTFSSYSCSAYVDLNGQRLNWSGSPSVLSYNQTVWLIDQVVTIGHNADGTKTFGLSASFSGSGGWSPGTLSIGSHSFMLTTIPRSSFISVGAGVIGSAVTINITRQSSSFKHTIRYHWGNKQGTIASNVDTSATWTIPNDFANDIPNSTSGTGTIYVDTYSGLTKIGTQSTTLTASVPASMKPTFSGVTFTDTNSVVRNLLGGNNFLQIISNIQTTFNGASGSYGSRITGYYAEIVNKKMSISSNGGVFGSMNFNGSATIRASVTDSRGRQSATKDITINVIEYFPPVLSFTANRTRENPSIVQIIRNAKVAPLMLGGSQKNTMSLSFKVAMTRTQNYVSDTGANGYYKSTHALTNSAANMANAYAPNKSFEIIGILEDKFTSTTFSATITTESVVMGYDKDGRVGIGKIPELGIPGSLDVSGEIYADGNPIQLHQMTSKDGRAIVTKASPDNISSNGMYYLSGSPDRPTGVNGYLLVEVLVNDWVKQTYTRATDGLTLIRVKNDGSWKPWQYVLTSTTPAPTNLINTGWIYASYSGSYYKRTGDMLAVKYSFSGNGGNMNIGIIPSSIWIPPQDYMLVIPQWSLDGSANTHIQFNAGQGVINAITTAKGAVYRGQILIMI
ncbi:hypothetical protein BVE84_05455 [Streptococcus azizii]|uniref:Capsid and scaffold protein n=1 Tax=Streptococcus azizii TaxID=1579424 RepID=A0AB36JPI1_9STRE|nr:MULTISPECIES: DUF859 domain-containing protein [Streptococcus]QBX22550.1 capsid and scaffold protein [Streptococcus phage Javan85]QBX31883.1 capsid and scaffold protein [Streptococcus phage Javan84]MBF0775953.1 DUF859 domain-containing protein [Streptococcus sp. 19428wD3_AN2]ONK25376.1 hypothetical protein BVE86_10465 [Streptococcus azizii]ONK28224.1 hypothetical protein BVE85_05270 [Streptococcus azizii]